MASPSYKTACIEQVFFLRWLTPPRPEDPPALLNEMRGFSQRLGKKIFLVSVVASNTPVPNADQRKILNSLVADSRDVASEVLMVVEGNELQHNLQRIIASAQLIVTRIYDNNYARLHKRAEDIAPFLTQRLKVDGNRIVNDARLLGLVT